MATQASAITFLSTPGQGYQDGLGFVQNYFGAPLRADPDRGGVPADVPAARTSTRCTSSSASGSTRRRGCSAPRLFLLQRGLERGHHDLRAGHRPLDRARTGPLSLTIAARSLLVIAYTVSGGTEAVSVTQKYQIGDHHLRDARGLRRPAVPSCQRTGLRATPSRWPAAFTSSRPWTSRSICSERYTFWSGLLGGFFLALSYFGADQSQVQRYIVGASLRESRLGLMFNAVCKIPMQFAILLLGVLLFVFYQFESAAGLLQHRRRGNSRSARTGRKRAASARNRVRRRGTSAAREDARRVARRAQQRRRIVRGTRAGCRARGSRPRPRPCAPRRRDVLHRQAPKLSTNDADYVFITFVLAQLPHGLIGLLLAASSLPPRSSPRPPN